jgi:hypothetical protein
VSKKRSVILGPDGKPYVAPPKPAAPVTVGVDTAKGTDHTYVMVTESHVQSASSLFDAVYRSMVGANPYGMRITTAQPKDLRAISAEQFDALTEDFDGKGGEELPTPPRDLTTYRDAYASARSNCKHIDAVELLYQRQWSCDDCGRILNRDDMRRAGYGRGYFS